MPNMFMLKARSRVVDVLGVVWVLTRSLLIVAVMLALLVSAGVVYAQGTPTVPTIESVAVTSDPGGDGGYAIGDEIQVGLTFSEAVTVTGIPQLTLDVGGQSRTAEYSEGSTTTQLLFTYTVPSGDEDTDGIAVVANSLALNGGAIRAGATNATLTHAALQANDHKVDGTAPTVTVGGESRPYVPPDRQFNVVFYFSEKVYGITDAEITVTNGLAVDVRATSGNDTWPKYTRWDVIIVPAAEGLITVTLEAGAGIDAYGNENTAPDSALEVLASNPVTVEVARTTSGFAEGGKAEFMVTRSRDNGAIPVFLSLAQTGDFLSGAVEVYPPPDPNNPGEPVTPQTFTFTETPFNLDVTFAAGETSKRIAVLTENDYRDEDDGTVTLSVPARTDQYKYIPGLASSASADVRDNDVPSVITLHWGPPFHPYDPLTGLDTALEGGSINLAVFGLARGEPMLVTLAVTEGASYLDLDGEGAEGYEDLGNGKLRVTLPVGQLIESVSIPLLENAVREADGSVTIIIEPDPTGSYAPSLFQGTLTIPVKDNDTPPTVSLSAADNLTEGAQLSYTLTRTWELGQSYGELSVNVRLAQTGDYITWPTAHQPDADGLVTIPVTFASDSLTATLTLETVDDELSEAEGSVSATIPADAGGSYVTGAGSGHTTRLQDNDLAIISVAAVSAEVTEGTDAQFRFSRVGDTHVVTRVGLWVGGLPKIMTDATKATVLTSEDKTVHIYGAFVDYILEFAAGETEKTLSFTTEADNVNEGDGWFGVRIVQRVANPFGIGTGYAQVHIHDDDVPTVSLTRPAGPAGWTLSADGTTWEGQIVETGEFTYSSVCTGVTEFSEDRRTNLAPLALWVMYANHPAHYSEHRQNHLGLNFANVRSVGGGDCAGTVGSVAAPWVGPENGLLEIELLAQSEFVPTGSPWDRLRPKVYDDFITQYEEAARAAEAAGTLITQKGIFSPGRLTSNYRRFHCLETDFRYCPKYLVGTVNKIRLTVINRDPTILIKAENSEVEEGQPARFVVERLWNKELFAQQAPYSTTVVSLRASQNGQYITGALPTEITFGENETSKIIELATVDDSAFSENGSVTVELLPDTTGADLNISGKYETFEHWSGHTPEGARSDRATIAITNNDDKPGITIAPASALEGDSGSADMTFTVTLAKAVTEAVTVNYATSDGTAIAGQDYTAVSNGSVTIAAGNTTAEFTVSMTGDETDELNETFKVTISLPSDTTAAAITGGATAAAAGTILDDDPAVVTVAPKKSPVTEGEEVVFVLTRTGVTDEELYMLVNLEGPARGRHMIAKFDADAVTTELSVATENNDLVDYPSERDYTLHLYGDGYFGGRDDESYTPGDPGEATVTVQDNDALVVVTVEPVTELVSTGESVQFRFRRTGSTTEALTISFQGFEHPSSGDATLADASVTFLAGNDTVVYTNDVTSNGTVNPISRAHTVLIYGDAGRGGLHRSWIAGDPNRATVVVAVDALGPMPLTASYPSRVAAAESASVEYTVTNLGTRALPGYEIRVSDGTRISTSPDRGSCDITDEIPAGESRTCSASFTVTNQDVTNGKIEFNATARNHHKSSTLRVYIRVAQPVEFGFTTADTLEVTEGPNVTATLPVTRTGRLDEAVTVAYRLRPHGTRPATLGEDFTDPSSTPGLLTFPANATSANIVINITQDQIDEERERFRVVLVPLTDGTITEGKNSRVVRITDEHQDNDPYRPTASLQLVSSGPVPENEGPVEFAIVLDRVWGREGRYEVEVLLDQSTATPGFAALGKEGDFEEPLIRILRIPAGQTRFEFSVPLYDDDVREEDETFLLQLTSPYDDSYRTIGASNRALATIADDDRVPPTEVALSLSHNGSALESVPEGSTQQDITVTASFPRIRWPGDAADAPLRPADPRDVDTTVRVQFDPNSGATHAAGLDDFAPLEVEDDQGAFQEVESFDIAIPAGQTSGTATLRFKPVNDDVDEEDETVTLLGSELVAGGSADSLPVRSASFTIIDDDTRGITVSPARVLLALPLVEGGEPGTYSLVLDSQPTDTVVITLAGNQGGFLRLVPDTLTFTTSDWATPQTVSVVALDDGIAGGAGSQDVIAHQVSGGDYGSVTVPDISTSIEDTTKAFVYLEGGQASESDGHVEFTVTVRPILRTTPVLVRYATVDGTAIAGSDYTRDVETGQNYKILNIPAGQSRATIRIPITDDQVYESAAKTFTLQLTNHNNKATLDGSATSLTATGTIADDDPKPVVSVAGPAGEVSYVSENLKDPVTFTLTLIGQSAGDVTVDYATGEAGLLDLFTARQGPAGATENEDYAGTSGTVTFTPGQTTKTVTVQVTNDDVSEDTEFFGFKISNPQGADLRGQRSGDVADVGLLDDDPRGVTIDPASISLAEPASGETAVAGAYAVNLNSKPTDTVTVTIGGGDPAVSLSGDTLTNNQLTFTTTNWNTAQTITVTPVKDDNAVGETVTLTHTLSGGDYAGIAADSVTVNLTDSDARNLVLSEESLAVTEGDATGVRYTVKLATQPSATVIVTISGHDGADLTLSGTTLTNNQLTFTTTNWGTAQTVTVKAGEDNDASNDTATLTHTASGGGYVSISAGLTVTVTDDDEPGVTIEPTALSVVAGRSNEYAVRLATEPTGDVTVTVTVSGHASTDVTLDKTTLTFTVDNWATAQTVTVSATQNASTAKVTLAHGVSGADYGSVTAEPVVVSVVGVAGQQPTLQIGVSSSAQTLTVPEGGANSYTLVLGYRPPGDVTVGVTLPAGTDLTLNKTSLTFTVDNWDVAQTVAVTAAEDHDAVTDAGVTLTHTVSGGGYGSTTVPDVEVSITENDTAGVVLSETGLTVTEEYSAGSSYTVKLATQPSGEVTVTVSGQAGTDLTLDKTTLTFTVDNWATAQTVTVKAGHDNDASNDTATLTHTASGGDYASVSNTLPVTVTDDDTAAIVLSETDLTVTEEYSAGSSYTVKLATQPSGEVTVTVSGQAGTDLSLDNTTLTFTVDNWATAQTVTVEAGHDNDASNDTATLTHTASGGGYASVSNTLPVTVTDDDEPGVTIEPTALSVVAGRSNEYAVALATEPTGDVTVTVSGHASTDLTLDKTTLTFTVDNWATAQTVTVSATQNASTAKVTLAHGVSGADYGSVTAEPVVVSVVGVAGQQPTLQIGVSSSAQTLTVPEGGANSYTLVLGYRPPGDVTVGVTLPAGTDLTLNKTSLTFTMDNWDVAQTVAVTAAEDDDAVTDAGVTLTHTVSGGGYGSTTVPDVEVSITENDNAGLVISKDSLTVGEGVAAGSSYTVKLATQPSGEVTVTVSGQAGTDLTLDKTTLTFTVDSWATAQTVTVEAGQDDDAANYTATLTHTASGGDYASVSNTLPVTVTDDDTTAIVLSETGLTVTEEDAAGSTYTVKLATQPSATVIVTISGHGGADLTLSGTTLTNNQLPFTTTNWGTAQTVTVKAGHDNDASNDTATLTHTASGGDYAGIIADLPVTVTDDDGAGVSVSESSLTIAEGSSGTYTIVLDSQPTADVTVTINDPSNTDVTAEPASLTFSSTDWNTPKTVTVNAAQDADADDDTATVTHTVTSTDSIYSGASANSVAVMVTDDEVPVTVQFGATTYEVVEGETVTVAVTLSADPERTVVIPLAATEEGGASSEDYSGVPSSVTINAGETSKTFEFMAMADDASDTGEGVMIGFGTNLPSRVTEGTPNEARVTINQVSTLFSLDCSLTATVWCADLGFSDRVAENYGWLYMRYGHGWDPQSSLSDDDFRFRGVDYHVRSMELRPGTHPVMPNAWSKWQQGYSSFRIGIYWDNRWGAPSEEHYRDWVLNLDGLELPFKDALRHGGDFVWVGEEFQQVFNDWTPSTVTKIGIKEVAAADQDTNPLLPWAPMQVDAWPEGPDRLLIVWAKPAWFYPGLPDPTSYIVQWKLASADWSDSAAVSQLEVAATSNFHAVIVNGMTEDAVYSVRVIARNDAGDGPPSEETLGRPQDSLPRLIATTVNGQTLTLRFSEQLDPNAVPAATDFVVKADGGLIMVDSVAISGDEVILTLHHAVTAATHSVLVRYDKPTDPSAVFLQDTDGNYANIRQHHELLEVVNITPQSSVQPLTAQFTNMPNSHDGRTRFTFDIEFSEPVWIGDGLARDDMLEITGGTVISAPWKDRRTDKFIVHVRPDTQGDIVIVLPGHRACHGIAGSHREVPDPVAGAPCAVGTRVLTNEPTVTIPGPSSPAQQVVENTPAEGEPQISGIPEVGQTLSADTTAIADADGLENAVFQYQWLAEDADISGATGTTYTVVSGDVGQAIRVRVTFTDDAGHEETLTSAPTVVTAGLQLQSATVDGTILTLTYSEVLDTGVTLGTTPFAVSVNGSSRLLIAVGVGESNVLLLLSSAVEAGDTVTVDYTVPDGPDFIRDIRGRKAASFSGQAVANDTASASDETASVPLTASAHDAPSSHNGQDAFTFELRFSEDPKPDLSYATVRDHAFTVTGGSVTYVRRLDPPSNIRWEITVTPGSGANVTIALNATTDCSAQGAICTEEGGKPTDCSAQGAICTEEGGKLSGGLQLAVPGPNTPATGLPTITGAAQVGETLTADTTGISDDDGLGNAAFAYQWLADDAQIASASSYTLVAADAGKAIKVRVSFTDDAGNDERLTSAVTGAVAAAPPPPNNAATGAPTITGTAQVGETLTADTTGISDDDGLGNAAFAYQWLADDAEIASATASSYTLVAADAGKAINVKVSFTDDAGNDEQLTSAVTGAVAPAPPPPNTPATGLPTITGTAQVGETLTADTTGISDDDGLGNAAFAYQWLADDAEIDSATASSYTLVAADAGKVIKVRVSFTDDAGNDEQLTSAGTGPVAAAPPPPNTPATGLPTITGTAQVGETLTADTTGISDDDGLGNAAFAYQWLADDAEIDSATASSYTLVAADAGKAINVRVSFTDDAGNGEQITSAGTGAVAPAVVNPPLTASAQNVPSSHDGSATFIFELRFSEDPKPGFSYTTVRDQAFTVTGGAVTYVRRLEPGKNVRWEITVTPSSSADVAIALNATTDCSAQGAICTEEGGKLSGGLQLAVPGPNTPATGLPTITGAAQVGDTLTAVTSGIEDADGLDNAAFAYQWLADDAEIDSATASSYTLVAADAGKAINVKVSFTDDAGNDEQLTSAGTGAVAAAPPPPNTPATGLPTITGTAQVGETLTADTTGISDDDGLGNAAFAYQWLADDAEIDSATASSYTLVAADAGKAINVKVSFTDDAGNGEQLTSAGTGAVAPAPPPPNTPATGLPTITGTAQVGETLTADTTGISDVDGLGNAAFAYQWLADDAEINGANASTYTLADADAGKAIEVRVSFTDDAGNDEQLTSAGTGPVAPAPPLPNTPATGLPTITGTAQVGETLTADATGISDDDGLGNAAFAYQWLADDAEIDSATASSYTLVAADAGKAIKVRVSFTDDAGNGEQITSAGTGAVAPAPPPPNTPATGLPTITGTAQVGETLTADTSGISDGDGLGNAAFAYQWLADDAEINGANASTYTLADADAGKAIKVKVSFTDDAGNDEQLTSAGTGAVAPAVVNSPLTASAQNVPSSHDGSATFIFELRFSEELVSDFSYVTMRDNVLTVTGGSVTYVRRLGPPSNIGWEIHVTPDSDGSLIIVLPVTEDCDAQGATCTEDGRPLSNRLELTVNGPGQ